LSNYPQLFHHAVSSWTALLLPLHNPPTLRIWRLDLSPDVAAPRLHPIAGTNLLPLTISGAASFPPSRPSTAAAAAADDDDDMILDPVSFLDCVIFALCAIPQLLLRVGWIQLVISGLKALPFVCTSP
jgi:hypothetical protein